MGLKSLAYGRKISGAKQAKKISRAGMYRENAVSVSNF